VKDVSKLAGGNLFRQARRAVREPAHAAYSLWTRLFPDTPFPIRLPFGAWWLSRNDYFGRLIRSGEFESAEFRFVQRYVAPGMTVLDIGAHQGFYTLLTSTRVGPSGRVFSFEPSPRERAALHRHVKWNRRGNVSVQGLALGNEEKTASLFVVNQDQTGCNSLRLPASDVHESWSPVNVQVSRLDGWLAGREIGAIDFVKLDVEGGELDVLKGAREFLERRPRPVFLVEVQDIRTANWAYPAKEVISYLAQRGFQWFALSPDGSLKPLEIDRREFDGNYVAWPEEREPERLATFTQK
jgi:FkbM family methyltransferase